MSFREYKSTVEAGDTVIVYIDIKNIHAITVQQTVRNKKGALVPYVFQTTYGSLKVGSLVGVRYGQQVALSRGWAFVLQPTPELWTLTLPHRTQILYTPDISMVLTQLELRPGSVVCEAGTGSGSLSHAILRTVAPSGHLYTFDFHERRGRQAMEEFRTHGLQDLVTAQHRDVCGEGFGLDHVADAVFLDLPRPYDVIPSAVQALKTTGGRLCSFSPCIEQVQRTCEALRAHGFVQLTTLECLLREFQVRRVAMNVCSLESEEGSGDAQQQQQQAFVTGIPLRTQPGHTGFLSFATLPPALTPTPAPGQGTADGQPTPTDGQLTPADHQLTPTAPHVQATTDGQRLVV